MQRCPKCGRYMSFYMLPRGIGAYRCPCGYDTSIEYAKASYSTGTDYSPKKPGMFTTGTPLADNRGNENKYR